VSGHIIRFMRTVFTAWLGFVVVGLAYMIILPLAGR
jgi:hypothetical protein